jgi:GWxTD domain-containing protein
MIKARLWWVAALGTAAACGTWQRVGSNPQARPATVMATLFDAQGVYRSMGFFTTGAPMPFVGSVRALAGTSPDSTLVVLGVSLTNQALTFTREANRFVAGYRVEFVLRNDSGTAAQVSRDEVVQVASFQETLRPDESVIFQQIVYVPPGTYRATLGVRDRNGSGFAQSELEVTVPRFSGPGVAAPVTFYEGDGRAALGGLPKLLVNPRATVPYGVEPIHLYVEVYAAPAGARLAAQAEDGTGARFWTDTVQLQGGRPLEARVLAIPPTALSVGRAEVRTGIVGTDSSRWGAAPLFVSFSNQWAIANFDELLSLLRYFYPGEWVDSLRRASPDERPRVWRAFLRATDPNPITPDNEAVDEYLRRVQIANRRFMEQGEPGWLTDRGEVYISIGEPDEILDFNREMTTSPSIVRWAYYTHRVTLYFRDDTGFGRYRLVPESRAEFLRVRERVRREQ